MANSIAGTVGFDMADPCLGKGNFEAAQVLHDRYGKKVKAIVVDLHNMPDLLDRKEVLQDLRTYAKEARNEGNYDIQTHVA